MPKKKFGTNSKSEAARARKEDKKQTEKARQKAQKEAAMWQDDDKAVRRQREREEQRRRKQQQTAEKKALNRQLAQEDEKKTAQSLKPKKIETCKVTKAEIESRKAKEREIRERQRAEEEKAKKRIATQDFLLENPNQTNRQALEDENAVEARNVADALAVLGAPSKTDKHPEKRMKAAWEAYETKHLPRLKSEFPSLRLSQLQQMLRKDFQKSPDNPANQK
eukprot:m.134200 g.134200  ORF g.134200 m.134200 type:complete len:222 (-) comp23858_c0_seq2:184-849(-)